MQKSLIIVLTVVANYTFAQTNLNEQPVERKGFIIGLGIGAGALTLKTIDRISNKSGHSKWPDEQHRKSFKNNEIKMTQHAVWPLTVA